MVTKQWYHLINISCPHFIPSKLYSFSIIEASQQMVTTYKGTMQILTRYLDVDTWVAG